MEIKLCNHNIIFLFIACIFMRAFICDVINLQIYVKTYVVELCNQSNSEAFTMATRLSGRQVLDQILADESDPVKIVKAVTMTNSSRGSEFQVESDDSDSEEADDDGSDDVEQSKIEDGDVESTSDSDDDEVLYSIADSAPVSEQLETTLGQLGRDGYDERRAGDSFLSKSSTERLLSNALTARQACIENVIKGQPGPTSYAKQRVSATGDLSLTFYKSKKDKVVVVLSTMLLSNETFGQNQRNFPRSSTSITRQKERLIVLTR